MYIQENELKLKQYEFHQRKYLPWELKIYLTERRINEWNEYFNSQVYVSFSGGLDSTVLLHMVRKVLGNDVPAVFCNTGLEYPEITDFVNSFENLKIIKPEIPFNKVIREYGYPLISKETANIVKKLRHGNLSDKYRNYLLNGDSRGKFGKISEKWKPLIEAPFDISERCCDIMKKKPFKKYFKETGRYPFIGITQDEGFKREHQYNKTGCNVYDGSSIKSQPLGFWTKQDVLKYVADNNLSISKIYGEVVKENGIYLTTKEQRTGCMFCMFGCHLEKEPNRFQRMELAHPDYYCYCMKPLEQGGLGLTIPLNYIGVPYSNNTQIDYKDYLKKIYAPGKIITDHSAYDNEIIMAIDRTIGTLSELGIKYRKRELYNDKVIIYHDSNNETCIRCIIPFDYSHRSNQLKKLSVKLRKYDNITVVDKGIYFSYSIKNIPA